MKYCESCGTKLEDDATFCEECGAKQAVSESSDKPSEPGTYTNSLSADNMAKQINSIMPKLSETCTPAKREIRGWLLILLLIICSPLISVNLIFFLPEFLFWIVFICLQLGVLVLMWLKRSWKIWIKLGVTAAYVLMCLI